MYCRLLQPMRHGEESFGHVHFFPLFCTKVANPFSGSSLFILFTSDASCHVFDYPVSDHTSTLAGNLVGLAYQKGLGPIYFFQVVMFSNKHILSVTSFVVFVVVVALSPSSLSGTREGTITFARNPVMNFFFS